MTISNFSQSAGTSKKTASQDFHAVLRQVKAADGKLLLSCGDVSKMSVDGADKEAGISRDHISLVAAVKEAEGQFWDKDLYAARIENVRAGIRALTLSAILQDHPMEGRNTQAGIHVKDALKHLMMDYEGIRFVRKGSAMEAMIQEETKLAGALIDGIKTPDGVKTPIVSKEGAVDILMAMPEPQKPRAVFEPAPV